jgi:signal transduction histidine kinase
MYYLLFGLIVVAWLGASLVVVAQSALRQQKEGAFLSFIHRAAADTTIDYLRHGDAHLQSLVERFARDQSLLYCAVVSNDGQYVAHTVKDRVGRPHNKRFGDTERLGSVTAIRVQHPSDGGYREYRVPLAAGNDVHGELHMAVPEAGIWRAFQLANDHASLTLLIPILLVVLGAIVLSNLVSPLAAVDTQLRRTAIAPTLDDADLKPVGAQTAGAIGWNRLIQQLRDRPDNTGLERRLTDAMHTLQQGKSADVLNSLSDGVAVTDHEGKVTFASEPFTAMVAGKDAPNLTGQTIVHLLEVTSFEHGWKDFLDPELAARPLVRDIERGREPDHQVFRVARNPLRTESGATQNGHVWSVRDVTQQRLAEKMRSQFLDAATHELRTPLSNIKAYAETLALSDVLDVENQKQFCNTINSEATRLARFIDDLLSISSMEVGALALDRQDVDLERLLHEVVHKVQPQMNQKGISFQCIFPEKYPKMKLDKDKVNVALVNLLGNAAKYTPANGRVAFKVQRLDKLLRIDIEDSGFGISEEELPHIFDKFFRSADPAVRGQTGTGLGLAMSQEVIRLHGGDLTVESAVGEGSTFTAIFPLE